MYLQLGRIRLKVSKCVKFLTCGGMARKNENMNDERERLIWIRELADMGVEEDIFFVFFVVAFVTFTD